MKYIREIEDGHVGDVAPLVGAWIEIVDIEDDDLKEEQSLLL